MLRCCGTLRWCTVIQSGKRSCSAVLNSAGCYVVLYGEGCGMAMSVAGWCRVVLSVVGWCGVVVGVAELQSDERWHSVECDTAGGGAGW